MLIPVRPRLFLLVGLLACVTACGGGGGGGGGSAGEYGPSDQEKDDAANTALYGLVYVESIVELANFSIDAVLERQRLSLSTYESNAGECEAGSVAVTHADLDNSATLTAGDELLLTAKKCESALLYDTVNGQATLHISEFSNSGDGTIHIVASVTFADDFTIGPDESTVVRVSGTLALNYELTEQLETLSVELLGDSPLEVVFDAATTESLVELSITRAAPTAQSDLPNVTSLTVDIKLDSDLYEQLINCRGYEVQFDQGGLAEGPDFRCETDIGTVAIENNNRISFPSSVSPNPEPEYTFNYSDVFNGALNNRTVIGTDVFRETFQTGTLSVTANAMVRDPVRDQVLIATAATSDLYAANHLIAYVSGKSITVYDGVTTEINQLRFNAAGDVLYALTTDGTLNAYSFPQLELLKSFPGTADTIESFVVAPDNPGLLAIYFSSDDRFANDQVSIFQNLNLVMTTEVEPESDSNVQLNFGPANDELFITANGFTTRFRMVGDALVVGERYRAGLVGFGQYYHGYFVNGSTLIDTSDFHKSGRFEYSQGTVFIDEDSGLGFSAGLEVRVCDLASMVCFNSLSARDAVGSKLYLDDPEVSAVSTQLLVASQDKIFVYDKSDLGQVEGAPCELLERNSEYAINSLNCRIVDVVYDELRNKIYALNVGDGSYPFRKSQIAEIDPVSNFVQLHDVPLASSTIELSADRSIIYLHDNSTDVVNRINVEDFSLLEPLIVTPIERNGIFERTDNFDELFPSLLENDVILLQGNYSPVAGGLVGLSGSGQILLNQGVLDNSSFIPLADGSFLSVGTVPDIASIYSVMGDQLMFVDSVALVRESYPVTAQLSSGDLISTAGEVISLTTGEIGDPLPFTDPLGVANQGLVLDGEELTAFAISNTDVEVDQFTDNYFFVESFDLATRQLISAWQVPYGDYSRPHRNRLKALTSGGQLVYLTDEGLLDIFPSTPPEYLNASEKLPQLKINFPRF
ncbi:hypothetical protein [Halioxenophilus sp. WMMB6]|uniref:hypothetical protein n=1 Tax=Halioxenophilus sp. WMMB6 TaxID=3073815 RepID=UPI00295F116A|nr:hypothetical protein [Halioxenophilus sp. WMMB6]